MAAPRAALAQAASPTVRLRGTIEALTPTRLTLRERGGERIELALPANLAVTEVYPVTLAAVKAGHRPFDFLPQSTMTNATVADLAAAPEGRKPVLKYKDGEKTIVVPPEAPIVSLRPADRALLAVGGAVAVTAQAVGGQPTALRISAGRNGFAPPC